MIFKEPVLVVVVGPTAVGKTKVSIDLARHFQTEILSADSRQFYREMKIGTASPSVEELQEVHHHFIGHLSISDSYNVSRFETDTLAKLAELYQHHRIVILTGGSGLYINAVCHGIDLLPDPDPELRLQLKNKLHESGLSSLQKKLQSLDPDYFQKIDQSNPARLIRALEVSLTTGVPYSVLRTNIPKRRPFKILKIGLNIPRETLNQRINTRVDRMIDRGLLEEARRLQPYQYLNALNSVGYKELFDYFRGTYPLETAIEKIKTNTRRYAKRQMTWFRKDDNITWFSPENTQEIISQIENLIHLTP
jgi:tRNA dimethylallyltransferase